MVLRPEEAGNSDKMTFVPTTLLPADKTATNLQASATVPTTVPLVDASTLTNPNAAVRSPTEPGPFNLQQPSTMVPTIVPLVDAPIATVHHESSNNSGFTFLGFQGSSMGNFNAIHEGTQLGMESPSLLPSGYHFGTHNYENDYQHGFSTNGLSYDQLYVNNQSMDIHTSQSQMNWGLDTFGNVRMGGGMLNNFYASGDLGLSSFQHPSAIVGPSLAHHSGCGTPVEPTPLRTANTLPSTQAKSGETASAPPAPTPVLAVPQDHNNTQPELATNTNGIATSQARALQGAKENHPPGTADGKERGVRSRKSKVVIPEWLQSAHDYLRGENNRDAWAECIALWWKYECDNSVHDASSVSSPHPSPGLRKKFADSNASNACLPRSCARLPCLNG